MEIQGSPRILRAVRDRRDRTRVESRNMIPRPQGGPVSPEALRGAMATVMDAAFLEPGSTPPCRRGIMTTDPTSVNRGAALEIDELLDLVAEIGHHPEAERPSLALLGARGGS